MHRDSFLFKYLLELFVLLNIFKTFLNFLTSSFHFFSSTSFTLPEYNTSSQIDKLKIFFGKRTASNLITSEPFCRYYSSQSKRDCKEDSHHLPSNLQTLREKLKVEKKRLVKTLKEISPHLWPADVLSDSIQNTIALRLSYLSKLSQHFGRNHPIVNSEVHQSLFSADVNIYVINVFVKDGMISRHIALSILECLRRFNPKSRSIPMPEENDDLHFKVVYHEVLSKIFWIPVESAIISYKSASNVSYYYHKDILSVFYRLASDLQRLKRNKNEKIFFHVKVKVTSVSKACKWFLNKYPIQFHFINIFELWLNVVKEFDFKALNIEIAENKMHMHHPSLSFDMVSFLWCFLLEGVESACKPSQKTVVMENKKRKKLLITTVSFLNHIFIVCNDLNQSEIALSRLEAFLSERGLSIDIAVTTKEVWTESTKFNFFGRTFSYCGDTTNLPKNSCKLPGQFFVYSN